MASIAAFATSMGSRVWLSVELSHGHFGARVRHFYHKVMGLDQALSY